MFRLKFFLVHDGGTQLEHGRLDGLARRLWCDAFRYQAFGAILEVSGRRRSKKHLLSLTPFFLHPAQSLVSHVHINMWL